MIQRKNLAKWPKLNQMQKWKRAWTVLNMALILAMALSLLPLQSLSAQTEGNRTFLPAVIGGSSDAAESSNDDSNPNTGNPSAGPRQLAYVVGQTYTYDWDFGVGIVSTAQDSDGTRSAKSESSVTALVDIAILEKSSDGVASAALSIRNPKTFTVDEDGTKQESDDQQLQAMLALPLAFKQAANGQILAVQYAPNASTEAVNFQKSILNALQLTLADGDKYVAEEAGYQGRYSAQYEVQTTTDALLISRSVTDEDFDESFVQGDEVETLDSTNRFEFVLDKQSGVLSSVTLNESISLFGDDTQIEAQSNEESIGIAASAVIESHGSLKLVETSTSEIAIFALSTYESGGLAVTPVDDADEFVALSAEELAEIDVDGELDLLEADPTSPGQFMTLLELVEGQALSTALISTRLQSAATEEVARAYVDLLDAVGTTAAQKVLTDFYAQQAPAVEVKEQILFALALQEEPSAEAVNLLHKLTLDAESELQDHAALALGAVGETISTNDATQAMSIANTLSTQLRNATENGAEDGEALANSLHALGNLGHPSTLSLVASYLDDDDADVRVFAVDALRNMPDSQVVPLLVDRMQNDANTDVVAMAASTLQSIDTDDVDAFAALDTFEQNQPEEDVLTALKTYRKYWGGKKYGHRYLGVSMPGYYNADSKAVSFKAQQKANAHIFKGTYNVVNAEINASKANRSVKASIKVGSKTLAHKKYALTCVKTLKQNLYNRTRQIFKTPTLNVPISGPVSAKFKVKGTAHLSLPWEVQADFCNVNKMRMNGTITPQAKANVKLDGSIAVIGISLGGATLDSTLMNAKVPVNVEMTITSQRYIRVCRDAEVTLQPVSTQLKVWAGRGWLKKTWTPWKYDSSTKQYTLIGRRCFS